MAVKLSPLMIAPPLIFAAIAGFFLAGIMQEGGSDLPSTFVDRLAPPLPDAPLANFPVPDHAAILSDGEVKIVNFWASWCPPCRAEHESLMQLAAQGVSIYGINKSDQPDDAMDFLDELGNPFAAIAVDPSGRQALEWGVAALPETFILDGEGRVILKFSGPIHGVMASTILPALEQAAN